MTVRTVVGTDGTTRTHHVDGRLTHLESTPTDGLPQVWNGRWHRKARSADRADPAARRQQALARWLGVLFAVGSVLFIMGGPLSLAGSSQGTTLDLVGSILFSVGAVTALLEAVGAGRAIGAGGWWRTVAGKASLIQLVAAGVVFQTSTIAAQLGATGAAAFWAVWVPSVLGGVGFVWSGHLYLAEARPAHDFGTRVAAVNLVGSWLFLVSALPGLVDPDLGERWADLAVNVGYTVGSVMFLVGGVGAVVEVSRPLPATGSRFPAPPPDIPEH
jgi:hypothetical protein